MRPASPSTAPSHKLNFSAALGIVERASRLMAANPQRAGEIETGVARLIAPNGMGTRFKVIGVRSPQLPPLPGFGTLRTNMLSPITADNLSNPARHPARLFHAQRRRLDRHLCRASIAVLARTTTRRWCSKTAAASQRTLVATSAAARRRRDPLSGARRNGVDCHQARAARCPSQSRRGGQRRRPVS